MESKVGIVKIKNPFNKLDRTTSLVDYDGETLLELRNKHFPMDIDVVTSLNGKIIAKNDLSSIYLVPNDYILFIPTIEGGGDDILRVVAMVVLAIVAIAAPYAIGPIVPSLAAGTFGGAMLSMGIMMVGGLLVNALLPPHVETPTTDILSGGDYDKSQTYSWNPQTTQQQGLVIPKTYGTMKATGNVISTYIENIGDNQYLNVLLCLGYGPIKSLSDFKLSDQEYFQYNSVSIETRLGYLNQAVISNFNDTKIEFSLARKITYGSPISYNTIGNDFNGLEIDITFPNGLYYSNDQGGLDALSETFSIAVANITTNPGVYYFLTNTPVTYSWIEYYGQWRQGYWLQHWDTENNISTSTWIDTGAPGSTVYADHYEGQPVYNDAGYLTYYYDEGIGVWTYPTWHWCGDSITKYATAIQTHTVVTGAQNSAIRRTYKIGGLTPGVYNVAVTKHTTEYSSARYGDAMYVSAVREVYTDDFQYPKNVLVGIKALATDQLSGSLDFSCMVNGALVRTYRPDEVKGSNGLNYRCITSHVGSADKTPVTGANWETYWEQAGQSGVVNNVSYTVGTVYSDVDSWRIEFSNNPAWVCYDVLSQPVINDDLTTIARYDGIDPSRLDTVSFKEWADFCDELVTADGVTERRMLFNGTFDSETPLWEAATKVAQMARAVLVWNGIAIKVIVDKPSIPVQMFSVGNIITDSFKETFLSLEDRASEVQISFINSEKGYEKDEVNIFNSAMTDNNNTVTIDLFGVTKASQVWREGMYRLYNNQCLIRTIEFEADVDAVACTVGDLVYVQHDVPSWSEGGRVVSASSNTITLEKEITLVEGNTYVIKIRLSDGTLVDKTILETSGTLSTFTLSSPFETLPDSDNIYILGVQNNAKIFRVIELSYTSDLKYTIKAIEYNSTIYNCDTDSPALATPNYSTLSSICSVTYLSASERLELNRGVAEVVIDVSFGRPLSNYYKETQIWYKDSSNTTWRYAGVSSTGYFKLTGNLTELVTYTIKAVSRNSLNVLEKFDLALTTSLFIYGKTLPPSDVESFWSQGSIGGLKLDWVAVPELDVDYYKIRYSTNIDDTWENSIDLATIKGTSIALPAAQDGIYFIKAVDTSGNESENAASLITTIPSILRWDLLQTLDESVADFSGYTMSVIASGSGIYISPSEYTYIQMLLDDVTDLDSVQDFDNLDSYYEGSGTTVSIYYGYYEPLTTITFTNVYDTRCSAEVTFMGIDASVLFDDIIDFDSITNFDGDFVTGVGVQPQIALSQDGIEWNADCVQGTDNIKYKCKKTHLSSASNKPITGSDYLNYWEALGTWTVVGDTWEEDICYDNADYQNFLIGDFRAMAYKFRLKLYTDNTTKYPLVTDLSFKIDVPERTESEQDIMCYSTGIHKSFTKPYFYKPKFGITIQDAQEGDYYNLESMDTVGFTLTIKNASVGVDRTIDWEVKGY